MAAGAGAAAGAVAGAAAGAAAGAEVAQDCAASSSADTCTKEDELDCRRTNVSWSLGSLLSLSTPIVLMLVVKVMADYRIGGRKINR